MPAQVRQFDTSYAEVLIGYPTANDFLRDYTRSLRRGWLSIEGSHELCPGMTVKVQLEIPGFDGFEFRAEVVECVAAADHAARARLAFCDSADRLRDAMLGHVERIRRRLQSVILAEDEPLRGRLEAAGYRTEPLPPPERLVAAIAHCDDPVVGVLVTRDRADAYIGAARAAGAADLVHVIDNTAEPQALLASIEGEE